MLTVQSQVAYCRLEIQRDPVFRQFCTDILDNLRLTHSLPSELDSCLSIELTPGLPVARILLDRFCDSLDEPQWIREKQLIAHTFSK